MLYNIEEYRTFCQDVRTPLLDVTYWMFLLMHCKEMQKIEEELEYPNFVLIAQLQFLIFFRRIAKTLSLIQNTSTGYSCQNQNVELYKL